MICLFEKEMVHLMRILVDDVLLLFGKHSVYVFLLVNVETMQNIGKWTKNGFNEFSKPLRLLEEACCLLMIFSSSN